MTLSRSDEIAVVAGSLDKELIERATRVTPGVIVFKPEVAIDIVEIARRQNRPVWGLDAFLLHPDSIQPDMQHDLDVEQSASPYDDAVAHLRRFVGTSYFFEVTAD